MYAKLRLLFGVILLGSATVWGQSKPSAQVNELATSVKIILEKCDSLYQNGDDIALELKWLLEAENLAKALGEGHGMLQLDVKKGIGFIYMDTDKNDSAITYFKEALALAGKNDFRDERIEALMYIGQGHGKKLEYDTAMQFLEKALSLIDEQDSEKYPDMKTNIMINIGLIYLDQELLDDAKTMLERALVHAIAQEDIENQVVIYNNLSIRYSLGEDYKMAISYIKKAIALNTEHQMYVPYEPYDNLGVNYTDLQQYDSARYYFDKSYKIASEAKDPNAISGVLSSLGWLYATQGKYDKGIPYLKRSYAIADSIQDTELALEASLLLADAYENAGAYSNALRYYEKAIPYEKMIHQNAENRKTEEFNVRYKTMEKGKEIAALQRENEYNDILVAKEQRYQKILWIVFVAVMALIVTTAWLRQRINGKRRIEQERNLRFKSTLAAEQRERKRIAQDLHDSLGQSISVLKMQANGLRIEDESEKPKHQKLLKQVDMVYDELRNVSHNIMPNTLITLGLVPAVKELISELDTTGDFKINLKHDNGFKDLTEDQTINLYRIIQEVFVNITKHAKASLVHIEMLLEDGKKTLYIKDNGVGMASANIQKLEGIGWKNIYSRVALLTGKIEVTSKAEHGTQIAIRI